MKSTFLFPRHYRTIGWLLFIPGLISTIVLSTSNFSEPPFFDRKVFAIFNSEFLGKPGFFQIITNGIADEILLVILVVGGLFIGFSKLRHEDEFTAQIRYESLVWALYFNFAVMIIATIFIYGVAYLNVMMANMFTLLLFFVIRFQVMLYRLNASTDEE